MQHSLDILDARQFLQGEDLVIWDCHTGGYGVFDNLLHFHDFYEFSFFYDGCGSYDSNGSRFEAKKGLITLTRPSDYHRIAVADGSFLSYYNIIFREGLLPDSVASLLYATETPLCLTLNDKAFSLFYADFRRLFEDYTAEPSEKTPPLTAELVKSGVIALTIRLISQLSLSKQPPIASEDPLIRSALIYIREHYRNRLTLSEVAEAVGRSAGYFSEYFHKHMQCSFSEYLLRYRLVAAASFVSGSSLPLKEIAYLCGFHSTPYFSSAFKHYFGLSPREYREKSKK